LKKKSKESLPIWNQYIERITKPFVPSGINCERVLGCEYWILLLKVSPIDIDPDVRLKLEEEDKSFLGMWICGKHYTGARYAQFGVEGVLYGVLLRNVSRDSRTVLRFGPIYIPNNG